MAFTDRMSPPQVKKTRSHLPGILQTTDQQLNEIIKGKFWVNYPIVIPHWS